MLPEQFQWIKSQFEPAGDPRRLVEIALKLESDGNLEAAATVLDLAYGLETRTPEVWGLRAMVLDQLAVVEHGLCFRYIPGGVFLMGSDTGEDDERPCHPVWLSPYWISETPISWAAFCRLSGWEPPPAGHPPQPESPSKEFDRATFHLYESNKLRLQYCEDHTTRAGDWHRHAQAQPWQSGGKTVTAQELFGTPPRDKPDAPWQYDNKPIVAVAWQEVEELAARMSAGGVRYGLPSEAQWEKAARGGLIGARYAWGDEPPAHDKCDFDHFHEFAIKPMKTYPANGYGLYAVCGGIWEWTRDWYDRDYYTTSAENDPQGPETGEEKVLRGGSWADCAEAVTVRFRMSRGSRSWKEAEWGANLVPNIGFRLCRTIVD